MNFMRSVRSDSNLAILNALSSVILFVERSVVDHLRKLYKFDVLH